MYLQTGRKIPVISRQPVHLSFRCLMIPSVTDNMSSLRCVCVRTQRGRKSTTLPSLFCKPFHLYFSTFGSAQCGSLDMSVAFKPQTAIETINTLPPSLNATHLHQSLAQTRQTRRGNLPRHPRRVETFLCWRKLKCCTAFKEKTKNKKLLAP